MKLTIRKTLLFSLALFLVLAIAALAVMFFRVNRTVMVDGIFEYRETLSVTIEEGGLVTDLRVKSDSRVEEGEVLLILSNKDLEKEVADIERKISMGELELESIENQEALDRFAAEQDVLSFESLLYTKKLELEYRFGLHKMNSDLFSAGSISKDRFDASRLAYNSAQGTVTEIEIQLRKVRRQLKELSDGPGAPITLKRRAIEIDRRHWEYLRGRLSNLRVLAPHSGTLLSEAWESFENTFLAKGTHVADVVSFDEINFEGFAGDTDIIRIKEGQKAYFDVEIFRRKIFVNGTVTQIGYKAIPGPGGFRQFPITVEVENKMFFDREQEFYIQAGVKGQAVIIVEEQLSLITLVWEKIVNFVDFGVYIE